MTAASRPLSSVPNAKPCDHSLDVLVSEDGRPELVCCPKCGASWPVLSEAK